MQAMTLLRHRPTMAMMTKKAKTNGMRLASTTFWRKLEGCELPQANCLASGD
jgi:hypothetical protein